jgi:transposase
MRCFLPSRGVSLASTIGASSTASFGSCDLVLPGGTFQPSIMKALTAAQDAAVQMIDTSMVRVHQHAACISDSGNQAVGRSRGGLTSKLHVVVDGKGFPLQLGITAGEAHDNRLCSTLLSGLTPRTMVLADRGYDADWIRALINEQGAWANIPPKRNRRKPICFSPHLYRARNHIERFFNRIKHCRRIATRYTNSRPITLRSCSWHQSAYGSALYECTT